MGFLTNPILSPMELERGISSLWDSRQPRPYVWEALRKESTYVLDMTLRNLARKSWFSHWERKWQPTPVVLPGKSHDRGAWRAIVHGVTEQSGSTEAPEHVLLLLTQAAQQTCTKRILGSGGLAPAGPQRWRGRHISPLGARGLERTQGAHSSFFQGGRGIQRGGETCLRLES